MVGGSWRALAQLHMQLSDWPLPVIHQYTMTKAAPDRLVRTLAQIQPRTLKAMPNISSSRVPSLPGAALLLRTVVKRLGSSCVIASAYGLREGLLYAQLPHGLQTEDPLLSGARDEGERQGRFPAHGDLLMAWMDGLFGEGEAPPANGGCGWPPACSATLHGARIPISGPSAGSTSRCTATGSR